MEYSQYLPEVIDLARKAGKKILEIYQGDFDVVRKDDQSPLTAADLAAHDMIVAGLSELTPDIPVLSEEEAGIPFTQRRVWQTYWLVDPLDGTREFVKRNGEFTVNIALIHNHIPVLGVIDAPVLNTIYYAAQGHGSWKIEGLGSAQRISVRPCPDTGVVVVGSRSHGGDSLNKFLSALGDHELRSIGSSLKSCLVAEGNADIYPRLGPTSEWDTAAAQCVVEEAGGVLVELDMQPLRYNTKESLLNPHFLVIGDCQRDWHSFL